MCQQQNFSYDEHNRLTNANTQNNCGNTTPGYSIAMSYDQVGNITAKTGVGTYNYNNGHAHQVSQVGSTPISYDGNGNASNGPNHIFNWNVDNQLASSSNQNDTESYAYDADGERVVRAVSGGTTTYFVGGGMWEEDSTGTTRSLYQLGGAVIAQRSVVPYGVQQPYYVQPAHLLAAAAGPIQAKTTSTPQVGQKEQAYLPCGNAVEKANIVCGATTPRFATPTPTPVPQPTVRLIYLHGDHLGSASVVTDPNGAVVSQQDFDPWGNLRSGIYGTISQTDVNYTGQVKDGSGLLYYHARYYDPFVSRFVSPDSIVPGGSNPQAFNRYSYVENNPLNLTDPGGNCAAKDRVACKDAADAINAHHNVHSSISGLMDLALGDLNDLLYWLNSGVSITGNGWNSRAINAVRQGLDRVYNYIYGLVGSSAMLVMSEALGLAGGLTFNLVAGLGVPGKVQPQDFGNSVELDQARYTNGVAEINTLITGVVHELGHIVDWHHNGATLRNRGDGYFWSTQRGNEWVTALGWRPGCSGTGRAECVIIDKAAASDYAFNQASGEDYAETFALQVSFGTTGNRLDAPLSGNRIRLLNQSIKSFLPAPGH